MMSYDLEIQNAAKILKKGGAILCPTDTIWGISANACDQMAVDKIYQLKERPVNKSMIVLVSTLEMLKQYVKEVPSLALEIMNSSPTPCSIIYPEGKNLAQNVIASNGSIAIRVVKDSFCKLLIEQFGKPIVSTSANISGEPFPTCFDEISDKIKSRVDYCVTHPEKESEKGNNSALYLIEGNLVKKIR